MAKPGNAAPAYPRELEYPVRVKFHSGETVAEVAATSRNVSVGGLLLSVASPIPQHTPVTFIMRVHGEQMVRPIHLAGEGEVVRVEEREADGAFAIAVQCKTPITQLQEFLPAV
jgi:hypothetical protein